MLMLLHLCCSNISNLLMFVEPSVPNNRKKSVYFSCSYLRIELSNFPHKLEKVIVMEFFL